jgi:hypothetical protein
LSHNGITDWTLFTEQQKEAQACSKSVADLQAIRDQLEKKLQEDASGYKQQMRQLVTTHQVQALSTSIPLVRDMALSTVCVCVCVRACVRAHGFFLLLLLLFIIIKAGFCQNHVRTWYSDHHRKKVLSKDKSEVLWLTSHTLMKPVPFLRLCLHFKLKLKCLFEKCLPLFTMQDEM